MHAISSYRGNSPTNTHTNTPTHKHPKHPQTGPITIHCAAAGAQCKNYGNGCGNKIVIFSWLSLKAGRVFGLLLDVCKKPTVLLTSAGAVRSTDLGLERGGWNRLDHSKSVPVSVMTNAILYEYLWWYRIWRLWFCGMFTCVLLICYHIVVICEQMSSLWQMWECFIHVIIYTVFL